MVNGKIQSANGQDTIIEEAAEHNDGSDQDQLEKDI